MCKPLFKDFKDSRFEAALKLGGKKQNRQKT